MIVTRRPFSIFDVDLVGAVMLGVLGVIAYGTVLRPILDGQQLTRQLSGAVSATEGAIARSATRLDKYQDDVRGLSGRVERRMKDAPTERDAGVFPQQISAAAERNGVVMLQMTPATPKMCDRGRVADVHTVARGGLAAVIGMLDDLRLVCPHMQVHEVGISQGQTGDDPHCTFALTMRMYILPESAGGKP